MFYIFWLGNVEHYGSLGRGSVFLSLNFRPRYISQYGCELFLKCFEIFD